MLKTCLFDFLPKHPAQIPDYSPVQWAKKIYETLVAKLESKQLIGWYDENEKLVDCLNCRVERGCCRKRQFTCALARQILNFLDTHSEHLLNIDYADDVEADRHQVVSCNTVIRRLNPKYVLMERSF